MKNFLNWLKWKFVNFLSEYEFPGDDIPVIRGSALKALEGDAEWEAKIIELMDAVDYLHPNSRA